MIFLLFSLLLTAQAEDQACYGVPDLLNSEFVAIPETIFPTVMTRNLHFVYKNYKYAHPSCKTTEVWVQGPVFTEDGYNSQGEHTTDKDGYEKLGNSFCMPKTEFDRERKLGMSVFETRVASGSKNEGTSFLIGGNIILTNHHIAGGGTDPLDCRHVEITLNDQEGKWIPCKRILFCEPVTDFCFVEMTPPPGVSSLEKIAPKVDLNCSKIKAQDAKLIGNSYTEGIQASDGKVEAELPTGKFRHRVPMVGGASGSPIMNSYGQVIGLNTSHDPVKDFVSEDATKSNYGTSMYSIFNKLRSEQVFGVSSQTFLPPTWQQQQKNERINKILNVLPSMSNCR